MTAPTIEDRTKAALDGLAVQIISEGHYQGEPVEMTSTSRPCCIIANEVEDRLLAADAISRYLFDKPLVLAFEALYRWNDRTDTDEVLETIRIVRDRV